MKIFDTRNVLKQKLHANKHRKNFVHKREIWIAHLWINIGYEQNGTSKWFERPVLVLKRFGDVFIVLPLTTKWKEQRYYHTLDQKYFWHISRIILTQIRTIDRKRFVKKIGKVKRIDFNEIIKKLQTLLFEA